MAIHCPREGPNMICPKCQANNNDQAKFCKKCGSQLGTGSTSQARQTSIECPNCHSANLTQARFCRSCGFALTNHPVAQPRGNQPGSAMQGYPMDPARRDGGRLSGLIEIANPEHPPSLRGSPALPSHPSGDLPWQSSPDCCLTTGTSP